MKAENCIEEKYENLMLHQNLLNLNTNTVLLEISATFLFDCFTDQSDMR